ncbi:MAG: hypothetical protein ACOCV4_06235, partial [Myxococcota bacterium]
MSAPVERLQELLTRVQRNRNNPRVARGAAKGPAGTTEAEAGQSASAPRPTPLEMAVEVELDRPKPATGAPPAAAPAAPSKP